MLTARLCRILIFGGNGPLGHIAKKIRRSRKIPRVPFILYRVIRNSDDPTQISELPPWSLNPTSIDYILQKYTKTDTSPTQYRKMFADLRERLSVHMFIFTDGSKLNNSVIFSITTYNSVLRIAKLDEDGLNISAEIIAIYEACVLVRGLSSRFVICTDSLSALKSVLNVSNIHLQSERS